MKRSLSLTTLFLPWLLLAGMARGDAGLDSLQVHGFLSQGFVKTDHNRFFGPSDEGSFQFTEIGINGSIRPTSSLLLSAQLLARKAGAMYDLRPTLDFAQLRWEILERDRFDLGVSIGRVKNPIGLYNVTRDVAHTRPSVFLPQAIYYDKVRNLQHSSDGVLLHASHFSDVGEFALDLGLGQPILDSNVERVVLGRDWAGELRSERPGRRMQLRFSTPDAGWRLALSYADLDLRFRPGTGDLPGPGRTKIRFIVASAEYNAADWAFTAEYLHEPVKLSGYGAAFDTETASKAWYLQGRYFVTPRLSLHLRYEQACQSRDDCDGRDAAARSGFTLPASLFYAKAWTLGLRWEPSERVLLGADLTLNHGNYFLSSADNPDPSRLRTDWKMLSLLAAYRF